MSSIVTNKHSAFRSTYEVVFTLVRPVKAFNIQTGAIKLVLDGSSGLANIDNVQDTIVAS